MSRRPAQSGQILVIFAGGLVTILLIAALVIDLGFTFVVRRTLQNTADPGALAAARYIRTGLGSTPEPTKMRQAACFYAEQNGFFPGAAGNVDGCSAVNDPNGTTLAVNYPPISAAGTPFQGSTAYVEVILSQPHHSFLAGIVGITSIGVSSSAIAAFDAGDSNSSSLIALDPSDNCTAGRIHGTGDITIVPVAGASGGYVHVNSTCSSGSPNTSCDSSSNGGLVMDGDATLTAPHTYVSGTCKGDGLLGPISEGVVQIGDPLAELAPPKISDYPAGHCVTGGPPSTPTSGGCQFSGGGTVHLDPGVYYGTNASAAWDIKSNVTLELGSGIYILAGGGVKLSNTGSITSVQGTSGGPVPVLIFNTDNPATGTGQSNIDFNASGTLKLRGMTSGPYKGIAVWNDGNGSNPQAIIDLKGQSVLDVAGTIYSPKGLVNVEGGSSGTSTAAIQIIAFRFDVGGNGDLLMPYDPNGLYHFPAKGLVH